MRRRRPAPSCPSRGPYQKTATTTWHRRPTSGSVATRGDRPRRAFTGERAAGRHDRAKGPTLRPELLVPGTTARYVDGPRRRPDGRPARPIQQIVWAGNQLIGLPYIYGGGHGSFIAPGYDCSGTVSFALHGANLLATPEDSSEFMALGLARRRALGHDLLQPRTRLHDRRGAAPGHQRRGRPHQRAGPALAPAAPGPTSGYAFATRSALSVSARPPASRLRLRSLAELDRSPRGTAIGGSDGRLDRAHVHRREGEGLQAARPRRRPGRDARLQLPEAGRTAAERQEGHRRRGDRQEAPADAGELAAAERRQARHAGPPGAVRRPGGPRANGARTQERGADRAAGARHAGRANSKTSSRS